MGVTIFSFDDPLKIPKYNKVIDYYGEEAFLFHKSHRLCTFLKAAAEAIMLKRLSSEDGLGWLNMSDLSKIPGLCRDKFDRAVQLNDLESLGLIDCYYRVIKTRGLWETELLTISDLGLEVVKILKANEHEGLIVVYSGSRKRCLPATVDIFR